MQIISPYILAIFAMGVAFFTAAVLALYWAFKHNQFQNFEKNARSIFTDEEPEGVQTDFFPNSKPSKSPKL